MAVQIRAKDDAGTILASSERTDKAMVVVEGGWYFDPEQVDTTYLKVTDRLYLCPYKGPAHWVDLEAPGLTSRNIAWIYYTPMKGYEHIAGWFGFYSRETSGTLAEKVETVAT